MKFWYTISDGIRSKNGGTKKAYRITFETDSKKLKKKIEKFFTKLMYRKEGK